MARGSATSLLSTSSSGSVAARHLAQEVESEVAAAFGPFVVLLGQDSADQADDGGPVGEDADHVGAAADLAVEPFVGVVGPDLAPHLLRERGEGEDVGPGVLEVLGDGGGVAREGGRGPGGTGGAG